MVFPVKRIGLRKKLMKFSLLSISLVLTSNTAVAAAIPLMKQTFSQQSQASVELLVTVPQLAVVIFIALSSVIAAKIGAKSTVIIGLVVAMLSSVVPVVSTNFTIIMLSRIVLGAGLGLENALAVSMISAFFSGDEAATMIGFQSAFQGLGAALMTLVAGALMKFGWQLSFLVYLIMIPITLLFIVFVPNLPVVNQSATPPSQSQAAFLRPKTLVLGVLALVTCIIYMTVSVKLSLFMTSNQLGSTAMASTLLSVMQVANMVAGFGFGWIYRHLRQFTLPVAFLLTMMGFLLIISGTTDLVVLGVGVACNGVAFSLYIPYIYNAANRDTQPAQQAGVTALILVLANIGNFISPYGEAWLGSFGIKESALENTFFNGAIIMGGLAAVITIYYFSQWLRHRT